MPRYTLTETVKAALWSTASTRDTVRIEPGTYDIEIVPTVTDGIGEVAAKFTPVLHWYRYEQEGVVAWVEAFSPEEAKRMGGGFPVASHSAVVYRRLKPFVVVACTHWGLTPLGKAIHERGFYESPEGGQEFLNQLVPR